MKEKTKKGFATDSCAGLLGLLRKKPDENKPAPPPVLKDDNKTNGSKKEP